MQQIWVVVWPLQGTLMFFDEFYLHRKRGLGKWESLGHPVDTFFFLGCFAFCFFASFSDANIGVFAGLAAFSSLLIAKDEWVHHKECCLLEQWVHTLLFIIHPVALYALFELWKERRLSPVGWQSLLIGAFLLYQIYYWNIRRSPHENGNN